MLVLLHDRLFINATSGVQIVIRREPYPKVAWVYQEGTINEVCGEQAVAVITALDATPIEDEARWNGALLGARLNPGCLEDSEKLPRGIVDAR